MGGAANTEGGRGTTRTLVIAMEVDLPPVAGSLDQVVVHFTKQTNHLEEQAKKAWMSAATPLADAQDPEAPYLGRRQIGHEWVFSSTSPQSAIAA